MSVADRGLPCVASCRIVSYRIVSYRIVSWCLRGIGFTIITRLIGSCVGDQGDSGFLHSQHFVRDVGGELPSQSKLLPGPMARQLHAELPELPMQAAFGLTNLQISSHSSWPCGPFPQPLPKTLHAALSPPMDLQKSVTGGGGGGGEGYDGGGEVGEGGGEGDGGGGGGGGSTQPSGSQIPSAVH